MKPQELQEELIERAERATSGLAAISAPTLRLAFAEARGWGLIRGFSFGCGLAGVLAAALALFVRYAL